MILVTGATGTVGRHVVAVLKAEGREARALVRDPAAAPGIESPRMSALVGDLGRAVDRAAALVGVTEIICCHSALFNHDQQTVAAIDGTATEELFREAAAAGVRHVTFLSHVGCNRPGHAGLLKAKRRAEETLMAQAVMDYTILRLSPLMSSLRRLPGLTDDATMLQFGDGEALLSPVSPRDVARLACRCGRIESLRGEVLEVGGPETYTWRELPALIERATQTRLTCWRLPLFVLSIARILVGLFRPAAATVLEHLEQLYREDYTADPGRVGTIFGTGLEDLVTWLRERDAAPVVTAGDLDHPPARSVEPTAPEPAAVEVEAPARATEWLREPAEEQPDDSPARVIEPPAAEPEPEPTVIDADAEAAPVVAPPEPVADSEPEPVPEPEPEEGEEPAPEEPEPAEEPEPDEPEPDAPAEPWGRHTTVEPVPEPAPEDTSRRPPVERPAESTSRVIDLDP